MAISKIDFDARCAKPGQSVFVEGTYNDTAFAQGIRNKLDRLGWTYAMRNIGMEYSNEYLNHTVTRPPGSGLRIWFLRREPLTRGKDERFRVLRAKCAVTPAGRAFTYNALADGLAVDEVRDYTTDRVAQTYENWSVKALDDDRCVVRRLEDEPPRTERRREMNVPVPPARGGQRR